MSETLLERVRRVSAKYDVSQVCFSSLAQVHDTRFSKYFNGQIKLPAKPCARIRKAADFIETIGEASKPFPTCFHVFETIKPLWDAYSKTAVSEQSSELETRAAAG
jgi:hypothetical protein